MIVRVKDETVTIEGYVNAVERDSKVLQSRMGQFVERIKAGAFKRALGRNKDVRLLLNHREDRDLGGTGDGNLTLTEDNIGLRARAVVTDSEVAEKARNNELVGWSFGFYDRPDGVVKRMIDGILHRDVSDMELEEVSILDNRKTPAYDGTLVMVRDGEERLQLRSEPLYDSAELIVEKAKQKQEEQPPKKREKIDYSKAIEMIAEMKGA
jgi:HK97 family phage prohead protease